MSPHAGPELIQLLTPEGERVTNGEFAFDSGDADEAEMIRGFYRDMVLTRRIDTESTALQRHGELGIWAQLLGWSKETIRGVCQPFIFLAQLTSLALLGGIAIDRATIVMFAAIVPALLAGTWVGWLIYGRLDERRFRQVLATLLALSGLVLVL